MKNKAKVLFIAQEIDPYVHESVIADICRKFPQYTQEQGCEIRVFMPCYGHINERRNQLHEVQRLSGLNIIISDNDHPLVIKVASIQSARIQVYFIDSDDYFRRRGISADANGVPFNDNDERSVFFVRSVLETIKKLRWTPDIVYCAGWMAAIAPMFIKCSYSTDPFFAKSKIVFSIFDNQIDSPVAPNLESRLVFDFVKPEHFPELRNATRFQTDDLNCLALRYSDAAILETPNVSNRVREFIAENNIPTLPYGSPDNIGARQYSAFSHICPDLFPKE
ncbi:MAG: glycogen/starch synthase [Paludibacteraceae bacterium]|nr:glycogen/starch synthase [Paludibacteraceae bacterium]